MIICSCTNNSNIKNNTETIKYREPLIPVDTAQSLLAVKEGNDKYQKKYINWQIKHNYLVNTLPHGTLAKLEANKKAIKSLKQVFKYFKATKRQKLKKFIANYNSLLIESNLGGSIRILQHRYEVLKEKIKNFLNNTTSNS